jgi:HSP20 family molecular chaperone IbpA
MSSLRAQNVSQSRKLELPKEIDSTKIAAQFENGVLRVRVPKAAKVQPVRIGGSGKASSLPKGRG